MKVKPARFLPFVGALVTAASVVHCAQDDSSAFDPNPPLLPAEAGAESGAFANDGRAPIPPSGTECAEENKQIYVLATDKFLYRFYPDKLQFVRIGEVSCPTTEGTFSMAVSRQGFAFVEYTDSRVFIVDTSTATCYTTPFKAQQGFTNFGMGFARDGLPLPEAGPDDGGADADAADDDADAGDGGDEAGDAGADADAGKVTETLYIAGDALGALDINTFGITFIGSIPSGRTELTARDTELFSFNVLNGVIAGLDKDSGATTVSYRTTAINEMAAFAFAQWGGDFWVFTGDDHSQVTQYSPDTNTSKVVMENTGMLIVGAGSSTCAPATTPR